MSLGAAVDLPDYRTLLARASERSGVTEAVSTGLQRFGGLDVVTATLHFGFLGGSMGRVHGDRVISAIESACRLGLPFLSVIASGGARMQEGFDALIQMARTSEAVRRARARGIPLLSYFQHPTTGGVHASYGALADVIVADAGATVSFAGPRVVQALTGQPVDPNAHNAEAYLRGGLIDAVVTPEGSAGALERWIRLVHPAARGSAAPGQSRPAESSAVYTGWDSVTRARRADRPSARAIIAEAFDESAELRGDRTGADDDVIVTAIARLNGRSVIVVGTDREALPPTSSGLRGAPSAVGFRKARRAFELAQRWDIPVVTLIDTAGADATSPSDAAGLTASIAESLVALLSVEAPTIAVVTGEGGSGGAMALACADRLVMQDDAVFEVIAPEGAAAILYRDPSLAPAVADELGLDAASLRSRGYSDFTLPGPTTVGPVNAIHSLRENLSWLLSELQATDKQERLHARHVRYAGTPIQDFSDQEDFV